MIYVPENIESLPIKLQHSSKSKPLLLEIDNESWEAFCHGVPVLRHSAPCSGWSLGFSSGQRERFKIRNGDGNVSRKDFLEDVNLIIPLSLQMPISRAAVMTSPTRERKPAGPGALRLAAGGTMQATGAIG